MAVVVVAASLAADMIRVALFLRKSNNTRGLPPAPRRAHKCALLMFAPWLGCGGVYSDVGSALGGVLCPALAPSQAPPLVRRTQDTPYALTFATTWLSPTSPYTLPLAHPLALTTPSGLQPLGESGSGLRPAVVFIGCALIPCGSGAAYSLHGSCFALRFTCARLRRGSLTDRPTIARRDGVAPCFWLSVGVVAAAPRPSLVGSCLSWAAARYVSSVAACTAPLAGAQRLSR